MLTQRGEHLDGSGNRCGVRGEDLEQTRSEVAVYFVYERLVRFAMQVVADARGDVGFMQYLSRVIALVRAHRLARDFFTDGQPRSGEGVHESAERCAAAEVN